MSLERALQAAQQGNFSFIESISPQDLQQILSKTDEDGRWASSSWLVVSVQHSSLGKTAQECSKPVLPSASSGPNCAALQVTGTCCSLQVRQSLCCSPGKHWRSGLTLSSGQTQLLTYLLAHGSEPCLSKADDEARAQLSLCGPSVAHDLCLTSCQAGSYEPEGLGAGVDAAALGCQRRPC